MDYFFFLNCATPHLHCSVTWGSNPSKQKLPRLRLGPFHDAGNVPNVRSRGGGGFLSILPCQTAHANASCNPKTGILDLSKNESNEKLFLTPETGLSDTWQGLRAGVVSFDPITNPFIVFGFLFFNFLQLVLEA